VSDEKIDDPVGFPPGPDNDYRQALIHVAWYREDRSRYLVFGMVELFPAEFPEPDVTPEIGYQCKDEGRQHWIYVKRVRLNFAEAIKWYRAACGGSITLPDEPNKLLLTNLLHEEPVSRPE